MKLFLAVLKIINRASVIVCGCKKPKKLKNQKNVPKVKFRVFITIFLKTGITIFCTGKSNTTHQINIM